MASRKKTPLSKRTAKSKTAAKKKVSSKASAKKSAAKPKKSLKISKALPRPITSGITARKPKATKPKATKTKVTKAKATKPKATKVTKAKVTKAKVTKAKVTKAKAAKPKATKAAKPKAEIIPLDPKTLKPLRKPKGKEVFYGIRQGKRVSKLPGEYTQAYNQRDHAGLNAALKKAGSKHFVVYEEMTTKPVTDKDGNIIYRKKGGRDLRNHKTKEKVPLRKTKITYGKTRKEQKPILVAGKKSRALDIGFQKRKKRDMPDPRGMVPLATSRKKWSQELVLQGDTLKQALSRFPLNMTHADFKKTDGLAVNGRIKIEGEVIPFRAIVTVLANFPQDVGKAARYALADQGMRFTSLVKLNEFVEDELELEDALLYMGEEGIDVSELKSVRRKRVSVVLSVQPL